jgi:hypothetical protein
VKEAEDRTESRTRLGVEEEGGGETVGTRGEGEWLSVVVFEGEGRGGLSDEVLVAHDDLGWKVQLKLLKKIEGRKGEDPSLKPADIYKVCLGGTEHWKST